MPDAFSAALDVIFGDPNMAADVIWRSTASGIETPARVIIRRPKELPGLPGSRVRLTPKLIDVRLGEVASPEIGDIALLPDGSTLEIVDFGPQDTDYSVQVCEVSPGPAWTTP